MNRARRLVVTEREGMDPAAHQALVADLPRRLSVLVADGVLSPAEADECFRHAHEVLADRLAETTERSRQ